MDFYKFAGKSRVRHTSLTSSQINVSNFTSSSSTSLLGSLMSSIPVARQKHSHTLTSEQSRASWVMSKNSSVILVKETMVNVSHLFHRHCSAGKPNVFMGDYFPASKEGYNISSVNMKKSLPGPEAKIVLIAPATIECHHIKEEVNELGFMT